MVRPGMNAFIGLGNSCLYSLAGQSPSPQRRILAIGSKDNTSVTYKLSQNLDAKIPGESNLGPSCDELATENGGLGWCPIDFQLPRSWTSRCRILDYNNDS